MEFSRYERIGIMTVLSFVVLAAFGVAIAQEPIPVGPIPHPDENITGLIAFLIQAFQGGNWFVVGAVTVMLTVWGAARFIKDTKWLPVMSAAVGMVYSVLVGFLGGDKVWYEALYYGLLTSGGASLFWSALGKRVLPPNKKPDK